MKINNNNNNKDKQMTKYKLTKEKFSTHTTVWHYRGFTLTDARLYGSPYANWRVINPEGQLVVSHTETRKQAIEWVDGYCKEMNDYVNSIEFNNIGE